jgi:beta-phosphoglucomutase
MVRAVVFDFDGVIANSEPLHFQAFRDVLAGEHIILTEAEYYERFLGYNDDRAFREIGRDHGRDWADQDIADLTARKAVVTADLEQRGSLLFPGVRQLIEQLATACPLAIASGALRSEIDRTLGRERLAGYFTAIVAGDDGCASKPSPEPYVRAVELLSRLAGPRLHSLAASECAAIEDSPWGLESARAAGLRTIGITHTYPSDALAAADLVVDTLEQLTWEIVCSVDGASNISKTPKNPGF